MSSSDGVLKPGASPFHVKGICFLSCLAELERRLPGGVAAVTRTLDAPTRSFFAQTFLAHSFYDILPLTTLEREAAQRLGVSEALLYEQLAVRQAEADIQGVHKLLLRFADADKIVETMPKLSKRYFNFLETSIEEHRPGASVLMVRGLPQLLIASYKAIGHAFVMRTLELARVQKPRHMWLSVEPDGDRDGVPLVALRRRIEWELAAA